MIQGFESFEAICGSGDSDEKIELIRPNLVLKSPQSNIYQADHADDYVFELLPAMSFKQPLPACSVKTMQYYTRMVNCSPTTVLGPPGDFKRCSDKIHIHLKDISFTIPCHLQSCFHRPDPVTARIRPDYIPRLIIESGNEKNGRTVFVMSNTLKIPRLKLNLDIARPFKSISTLIKLAFCRKIPMSVTGTMSVEVPPGYFSMDEAYENQYFTRSVFDQQRIYSPEDIVAYINVSATTLSYNFSSRSLTMATPAWVKAVVFSGIGLVVLLVLLTAISITRSFCLLFDDRRDEAVRINFLRPFTARELTRNGRNVLHVRKQFVSYHAYPGEGFHFSDMDDGVLAYVRLKTGGVFQINGPDTVNVIVEITSCAMIPDGCEMVGLAKNDNYAMKSDSINDNNEFENVDSINKGEE